MTDLIGGVVAAVLRVESRHPKVFDAPRTRHIDSGIGRTVLRMGNVVGQRGIGPNFHTVQTQIPKYRRPEAEGVGLAISDFDVSAPIMVVIRDPVILSLAMEDAGEGQVAQGTAAGGELMNVGRADEFPDPVGEQ